MTILHGTTRVVLLIGRWAIKVPSVVQWCTHQLSWSQFLKGLLANIQEAQLSRLGWPELCPVQFSLPGGFLIIMRRAEPLTRSQFFALNYAEWIKRGEDLSHGEWVVPVENKLDSFGLLGGRIVAVDYGN